jgi:L-alanine-DL-glutamate epimerase-like enolase superfamily enzyme
MKITGISLFHVRLPRADGSTRGRLSSIVRVATDEGVSGHGELVGYITGVPEACAAALVEPGDALTGEDAFTSTS